MNKYRIVRRELRNPETYEISTDYVIQKFNPKISVWFLTIEKENWSDVLENRFFTKTYKTFEEADKMLDKLKIPLMPDVVVGKSGGGGMNYYFDNKCKPVKNGIQKIKVSGNDGKNILKKPLEKDAQKIAKKVVNKLKIKSIDLKGKSGIKLNLKHEDINGLSFKNPSKNGSVVTINKKFKSKKIK